MSVARALISGLTPMRTLEKTSIGKVVAPGPETKLAITRSSSDSVKASSQPETHRRHNHRQRDDEEDLQRRGARSIAASSIEWSSSRRREEITTAT